MQSSVVTNYFGRHPDPSELSLAVSVAENSGLEIVCQSLINSNEFAFFSIYEPHFNELRRTHFANRSFLLNRRSFMKIQVFAWCPWTCPAFIGQFADLGLPVLQVSLPSDRR